MTPATGRRVADGAGEGGEPVLRLGGEALAGQALALADPAQRCAGEGMAHRALDAGVQRVGVAGEVGEGGPGRAGGGVGKHPCQHSGAWPAPGGALE
ncbi:hypothetical protein ABXN37_15950 [Piscinibacter sakaiensis]|uniref:hypothetical protein n=1 Tax=Piscinibacter sakaiensis TaxID=1547922 RepID=UPI00372BB381